MVITKERAHELLTTLYNAEASNPAPKSKAKAKAKAMPKIVESEDGVEPEDVPVTKPKAAPKAKVVVTPEEVEDEQDVEDILATKPKSKAVPKVKPKVVVAPEEVDVDEDVPATKPKAVPKTKAKVVVAPEEVEDEDVPEPKPKSKAVPKAKAKVVVTPEEVEDDGETPEPKPKSKAKKAKGTKVREGWEKGKKVYTIESIEPLGECSDFDSEKIPSTVRGENPSGAAKKVFTQIRKVVKDESPDAEILPFYRLTLIETPPVKGEGRFVYDAQTILLDEPKERRIESSNGKTSVIPIYYEYKVKAVKETHDEEKKGAAKKAKGAPKAKNAKVKEDVKLDHYKKAAETPIPEDEPAHDEVSEEVPVVKKAPKGAPKASAKGKL